jgi:hypothetical protein
MKRILPGSVPVEGREFLYLESQSRDTFTELFLTSVPDKQGPLPKHGGMMDERAVIKLPDGKLLHGLSYKGDIKGWRRSIIDSCEKLGIQWGEIVGQQVRLGNGQEYQLDACVIELY